jgi:hypothetical protein
MPLDWPLLDRKKPGSVLYLFSFGFNTPSPYIAQKYEPCAVILDKESIITLGSHGSKDKMTKLQDASSEFTN